jgi:hypothetical protein
MMENQQSTVVYLEHALVPQNRVVKAFDSKTLAELAPQWERPFIALVDGKAVLRKDWDITIYEGHFILFCDARAVPQGFFDSIFKAVLSIAVVAVAVWAGGPAAGFVADAMFATGVGSAALWGGLISGAVLFGGMAIVNALLPPALPGQSPQSQIGGPSPTYNLQAQGNYARLEQAIPEHFGRHLVFPDFAAQPYSSAFNNDVYLYQLFCIGRGEYDIETIRVEDTPIENFADVTWEIIGPNQPINLFPSNVVTNDEVGGQDLEKDVWAGPFSASDEGTKTQFIGLDFLAPRGLYALTQDAKFLQQNVYVKIEARPIDDNGDPIGDWASLVPLKIETKSRIPGLSIIWDRLQSQLPANWNNKTTGILSGLASFFTYTETISEEHFFAKSVDPQRFSLKFPVAYPGRYEVRCMRTNVNSSGHTCGHDFQWVGLKAFLEGPSTFGDTTCVAVAMRSSNQLSGQASRKVNMIVTRKLPIWNGSTWSALTATRSIAWAAAYCCKQIGKTDSEIDLPALLTLDAIWSARGDECNGRVDSFSSFWDALSRVCSAGRCKPYFQGGIIRFFRHQPQSIPVAMFSTRNMVSGSFGVDYLLPSPETADAIDVSYFDEDVWKPRRVQAKLPDSSADKPVKVDVSFITSREKAIAEGMYKAAANRLQRKMIRFTTEMEGFIPSFGDLIIIQHDMPAWGQCGEIIDVEYHSNATTWSENFSHSSWVKAGSGGGIAPVVTLDDTEAPDGTLTADKVIFSPNGTLSTNISVLRIPSTGATVIGQPAIGSFWLKTTDGTTKQISLGLAGIVNQTKTVTGKWQRFSVSHTSATTSTGALQIRALGNLNGGTDVSLHVWGASLLKDSDTLPLYVPTTSAAITDAPFLTTTEPLDWADEGGSHHLALRDDTGGVHGPLLVTKSVHGDNLCMLQSASLSGFTPRTGSGRERTHYTFGVADTWAQKAIVMAVKPRGHYLVDIEAINEEDGVHTAEDGVITPIAVTSQLGNYVEAPSVSGLIASPLPTDHTVMLLSWEPAPWADNYLIEASPNGEEWIRVGDTTSARYTAKAVYGENTIIRVAAVGLSVGAWAQVAYTDMEVLFWDETVSGLTLTPNKGVLDISWNAVNAWNVGGYELRYGPSWETGTVIVSALQSNTYSWQPVDDGTITIWLKAFDIYGAESLAAATTTLNINGPTVSNLSKRVIDNNILLSWTTTPGTFALLAAEVRRGLDFDTAEVVGRIQGDFTVIFETVAGTYKYWVVLQDIAGLYGKESGIYAIVSQPPDYVLHDQRELALTGTPTSAVISGGVLYAPVDASETFAEHFTDNSYTSPQSQINGGYPYFLQPAPATGSYVETIDYGATIPSSKITITLTRRTVAGTVTISPTIETSPDNATWTAYAGAYETHASNFRYVRVTLAFSTSDGGFEEVSGSMVKLDVKTKKIQGTVSAVSTDSGGTSVDITGKFVDVQSITVSPQGTTAAIAIYNFTDTPNPTSFKVLLFNTSGTRISGTVSYTVQGV